MLKTYKVAHNPVHGEEFVLVQSCLYFVSVGVKLLYQHVLLVIRICEPSAEPAYTCLHPPTPTCKHHDSDRCKQGCSLPQCGVGANAKHKVEQQHEGTTGYVAQRQGHRVVRGESGNELVGATKQDTGCNTEQCNTCQDGRTMLWKQGVGKGDTQHTANTCAAGSGMCVRQEHGPVTPHHFIPKEKRKAVALPGPNLRSKCSSNHVWSSSMGIDGKKYAKLSCNKMAGPNKRLKYASSDEIVVHPIVYVTLMRKKHKEVVFMFLGCAHALRCHQALCRQLLDWQITRSQVPVWLGTNTESKAEKSTR